MFYKIYIYKGCVVGGIFYTLYIYIGTEIVASA